MKRILIVWMTIVFGCSSICAQRFTDNLDRGLVAVDMSGSVFLSWRILAEEYYGVKFNVYCNGNLIAENLTQSNFTHFGGSSSNSYTVKAVVDGIEKSVGTSTSNYWIYSSKGNNVDKYQSGRLDITLAPVYDRNGIDVTSNYSPNDAEFADLNGDGDLEMIIKRLNTYDAGTSDGNGGTKAIYASNSMQFVVLDAYDINWQTGVASLMWRIDCGPNMVSLNSTEIDIIAYDWDEDGKAEVVLRGADNMKILRSDGRAEITTIGNSSVNTRSYDGFSTTDGQYAWTHSGSEYLIYMNGETGLLYEIQNYPLPRLEASEWATLTVNVPYNDYEALHAAGDGNYYTKNTGVLAKAWGDNYGHRSSKYFFGAPILDGRSASLFLGRGIYTRHKMIAMDLNKDTHHWSPRWTWSNNTSGSEWYGNGYHNFIIADVDEDGRDEIVYGSMVIDDNGNGLSTTGLGHGDAQHVSDFDPWRKGLEFFGCNEDNPGMNYRNATTSEIYKRITASGDDGRCLMANFSNNYPGSIGRSWHSNAISGVTDEEIPEASSLFYIKADNLSLNACIYWDGDLLSEMLDSPGTAGSPLVFKLEEGRLLTGAVGGMNNDSKNNPCFQGDLIGDWREEFVVRNGSNVSIYTSIIPSDFGFYSLWYDHQYRQAMVWQMMAYNQPPHLSFFLGELEDITQAPPPLTTRGRTTISAGSTISTDYDGQDLLTTGYSNNTYTFTGNIAPHSIVMNVPVWTQGHDDNNNITTTTYTHTLTYTGSSAGIQGACHFVKQGLGILNMPKKTLSYTGNTDIWGGTVNFNGNLPNSKVWMNRFTTLNTTGGTFGNGIEMNYDATLNVGGATTGTISSVTMSNLTLNYGARVVLDVESMSDAALNDQLNVTGNLTIDKKTWDNGPKYSAPVFEFNATSSLAKGRYPIGLVQGSLTGTLSDVVIEGSMVPSGAYLEIDGESKVLYLVVSNDLPMLQAPTIALTDMTSTDGGFYYYPTVSITDNNTGTTTSLSGTFTDLAGNTSSLSGTIYSEDFEGSSTASDYWQNNNGGIYSPSYTNSDGQCIGIVSSADRGDYITINADYSAYNQYTIEFDAYFNNASKTTDFAVMSNSHAASWIYNWGYHWLTTSNYDHNPYLFYMQRGEGSTTFTINETENATLSNATWYHFTLTVDASNASSNPTVSYSISPKGDTSTITTSGTYTLLDGEDFGCAGFYIRNGRYNYEPGGAGIDNINIYTSLSNSYTFTEPGTLTLTASADGYSSASATYEVPNPYAIYYESPDYNEISAEDMQNGVLGPLWNTTSGTDRWGNWNKNHSYVTFNNTVNSPNTTMYLDEDSVLSCGYLQSTVPLQMQIGYGVGQSKVGSTTTISAADLGDDNTIIYYKSYNGYGNSETYDSGYTYANSDGSYTYSIPACTAFCKLIAWVPVDEEYDETATSAPTGNGAGNVAMKRAFSSIDNGSAWNTLVLPFDMTDQQILTTFGPGTQVAQYVGSTSNTLIFNADTRVIHANKPMLIRVGDVHANNFYVFAGVTRNVDTTPTKTSDYFDFVGSYLDQGWVTFPSNSYFYNAANGNVLNRVAANNNIRFKGYRAYFSAHPGVDVKQIMLSFEDADALGIDVVELQQKPVDVYTASGLLIRRNATTLDGLPRGLYIVGKKKVVIN